MNLYSVRLESAAIKSITDGDEKVAAWLLPRLTEDHFSYEPTRAFFRRIASLVRKTGDVPYWDDLLSDLVIPEDCRQDLEQRDIGTAASKKHAVKLVESLERYRKARVLFKMTRDVARKLKEEAVDLDVVADDLSDVLSKVRGSADVTESMTHVGDKDVDKLIVMELLRGSSDEFIPTGIRAFDSENIGVARGGVFVIAATTGGGKSVMAVNTMCYQALLGCRVALVSLEMNRQEIIRRILSYLTAIPLSQINKAHELDNETRRQLMKAWVDFNARVRKNGGRLTIICPEDDVSMEDVLTLLKPYKYDNILVDYIGLCKGMDGDDQWRKLGAATRYAKRFAGGTNTIVTILAQLGADGGIRYSKAIQEHASLMWTWVRDEAAIESGIITVKMPKARNQKSFDFMLACKFNIMRFEDLDSNVVSIGAERRKREKNKEKVSAAARRNPSRREDRQQEVYAM